MNKWLPLLLLLSFGCEKKTFIDHPSGGSFDESLGGYHQTTFHDDRFNPDRSVKVFQSLEDFLQDQLLLKRPEDFVSCLTKQKKFIYIRELHENYEGQNPIHQTTKGLIVITRSADSKTSYDKYTKEDIWPHPIRSKTEFFRDAAGNHFETYGETDAPIPSSPCDLNMTTAVNQTIESGFFSTDSGKLIPANRIIKRYGARSNCSQQTLSVVDVNILTDSSASTLFPCSQEATIYSHQTVSLEGGSIVRETNKEILSTH